MEKMIYKYYKIVKIVYENYQFFIWKYYGIVFKIKQIVKNKEMLLIGFL